MRAGQGPAFIECKTERYMEHVGIAEDYAAGYRSEDVVAEWKRRDPLCCETALVARWTPEITVEIEDAVAFAEASPWPGDAALLAPVGRAYWTRTSGVATNSFTALLGGHRAPYARAHGCRVY